MTSQTIQRTRSYTGLPMPLLRILTILYISLLAQSTVALAQQTSAAVLGPSMPEAGGNLIVEVLVYGSEPEAIVAAVAAAEEGARTLLVTPDARLGGLFVLGELNMLDLRTHPFNYQRGLFDRWWRKMGRREAFDVIDAERSFEALLAEAGVEVWREVGDVAPLLHAGGLHGVTLLHHDVTISAGQVIDASADADLAAAAGAPFDFGWERLGVRQRMADTLVLNVAGVDWNALKRGVRSRGSSYAVAKDHVVWGHFGGVPAEYVPSQPDMKLRGLNLGLQDDGSVLVNALLLFGIDPLDAASLAAGRARGLLEGEAVVAYLRQHIPGFADARLTGGAEKLYVRESRHLLADCILSSDDVFDNLVTPFDVAAGGYPLDAQSFTGLDHGFVWGAPDIYGGRLCMMVTSAIDDLWVVGRSAGYDPVAFSSARVVPFGMSMAEAAGVAAAQATRTGLSANQLAADETAVTTVRERLAQRGAYLPDVRPRLPIGPSKHPNYTAFRLLVSRGLAVGGYGNDPKLDEPMSARSFAYLLTNVATRFYFAPGAGTDLVTVALENAGSDAAPLTATVASAVMHRAACKLVACPDAADWPALVAAGLAAGAEPEGTLSRGKAYELAAALARQAD